MIEGILIGIDTAFSGYNIIMVMMGCFAGTIIGMLPGLGPMSAIALMIPITYGFDPASAMILMAGVYYGAIFGGSTSSILINAPGVAGTVSSSFDGYPMAKNGQAGKALAIAAYASFSGGTIAALFLIVAAPQLAKVSLSFQSADYFALMCVGLLSIAAFASKGQFLKAMVMTALGLALATVGQDSLSDITRFAFGNINLMDGISFVLLVMATFAMSEAFMIIFKKMDISFKASDVSKEKLGFNVNTLNLWKLHGHDLCKEFLDDSRVIKDGWINNDWIQKHIDNPDLDVKYVNKFLGILAFEIWYRLFITKEMSSNTTLD